MRGAGGGAERHAGAPAKLALMRAILLLCTSSVERRLSGGKPSSLTSSLSDKSMLSNWFCGAPREGRSREATQAPRACVTAKFSTVLSLWPAAAGTPA